MRLINGTKAISNQQAQWNDRVILPHEPHDSLDPQRSHHPNRAHRRAVASSGQLQWTARTYNLAIVSSGYIIKKLGTSQAKELRTSQVKKLGISWQCLALALASSGQLQSGSQTTS